MTREILIGGRTIGNGHPTFVVAEIGINHNGDLDITKRLIDAASEAGVDAIKLQKRTPELCTPPEMHSQKRDTPWGRITYLEYRHKVEFSEKEYEEIDRYCKDKDILWFASIWDEPSVDFLEKFDPICYKLPSAGITDFDLLRHVHSKGRPVILSTGMSTMEQIQAAVETQDMDSLLITHATSTYPCEPDELNLQMIETLKSAYPCPIGYSGHEVGLVPSVVAVALGACLIERHITLDRAMWGSDQAASVEPGGFRKLVKYIHVTEEAMGDGVKKVYESELPSLQRLRRVHS